MILQESINQPKKLLHHLNRYKDKINIARNKHQLLQFRKRGGGEKEREKELGFPFRSSTTFGQLLTAFINFS
ncbi:hypothetical protein, partial [Escherichia coli]|uniref:hypothetical protein n=1 Tax=Escherichia coli TaxID=562 RepID=UPI003F45EA96